MQTQPVTVTFSDGAKGFLLTSDGQVWRTADGTDIWVTGSVFYGLTLAGFIEHSSDGGATWTVQLLGSGS